MIRFRNVTKHYPRSGTALANVSFHVRKAEFVFLTGPSGAGKTTVLRLVHMEVAPTEGEVIISRFSSTRIRRREIPQLRRRVGFVFQDFRLLERLTAAENIAFALQVTGANRSTTRSKVMRLLDHVGLAARASAYPAELSGGERQRVAIARALATDPLVLLADEPTGNLDERASLGVFELFKQLNSLGTAVILATHDATLLRRYPETRVLELEGGRLVYDSGAAAARPPDGDSDDSSIFELMPDGLPRDDTAKQPSGSKRAGPAP
ncbi:MAG: cell division ATP-binding protein FtsE [Gemmatimonadales bacterium]